MDWQSEDDKLIKVVLPWITEAVKDGASLAYILTQLEATEMTLTPKLISLASERAQLVTRINDTIKEQLGSSINIGIAEGETVQQISDRVREIYNMAGNRAKVIARTETSAAMNGSSQLYYKELGVEKKEWLTAGDERVRESHIMINGEIVNINQRFSNGVDVPGLDGSPEETINCRCVCLPVIE
jgi:SPP1 gp7 family putative phage head morphogenesis protein